MQAVGKHILVELAVEQTENKTPGGIIKPGTSVPPVRHGTVLAIGADVTDEIDVDDFITFGRYAGTDVGHGRLVLTGDDVLLVE